MSFCLKSQFPRIIDGIKWGLTVCVYILWFLLRGFSSLVRKKWANWQKWRNLAEDILIFSQSWMQFKNTFWESQTLDKIIMLSACHLITLYINVGLPWVVGSLQVLLEALRLALHNWRALLLLLVPAACWFCQSSLVKVTKYILRNEIYWKSFRRISLEGIKKWELKLYLLY